jgi:short-subunit dehydrogenase
MVLLTRLLLPELKSHSKARILNVSSMAAFNPLPYKTVYPASKAFISAFSRGLNLELKGTTVSVCTVHPGPMTTNANVTTRILLQGSQGKAGLLMASRIASITLKAIRKGHEVIVPGFMNKFSLLLIRIVPYVIRMKVLLPVFRKEIGMQEAPIVI